MVPAEGIEPPTFGLQNRCSTAELCRQKSLAVRFDAGSPHRESCVALCARFWPRPSITVSSRCGRAPALMPQSDTAVSATNAVECGRRVQALDLPAGRQGSWVKPPSASQCNDVRFRRIEQDLAARIASPFADPAQLKPLQPQSFSSEVTFPACQTTPSSVMAKARTI